LAQNVWLTVALSFLRWSGDRKLDRVNFRIQVSRSRVDWLEEEQVALLLRTTSNPYHLAMIAILATTGMRVGELATLREKDMQNCVIVQGKERKERIIPIDQRTWRYLAPYLERKKGLDQMDVWLVHLEKGRASPYNRKTITAAMIKLGRRLGFHISPHTLRRTFGRALYKRGCPLVELKEIMGHSSVEMTIKYLDIGQMDVQDAMTHYSPDYGELKKAEPYLSGEGQRI
jgi:integrase